MARKEKSGKAVINTALIRQKKAARLKHNLALLALCVPGLICLIIFNYLPMFGVVIAFKRYVPVKGIWGSPWTGLYNFEFFFGSADAVRILRNTVLYSLEFLVLDLVFGVLIAIMLYYLKSRTALKVYHTIMLMPRFMSIVIISFMVYGILSPTAGLANQLLELFGKAGINWYGDAKYWPAILSIVYVWKSIGSGCLYYFAALTAIDPSYFEAADLDGATAIQKAVHIMIPELIPIMVMMTILGIGGLFSGDMGLFYQVPKNIGILFETTDIINTYTFRALLAGSLDRSAAVGLFQSVMGLILVVGTNAIVRKVSPDNAMF